MSASSLEGLVVRSYVTSIMGVSLAIVLVSVVTTTLVVIERDDSHARAQARTLGAELHNHRGDTDDELDELIKHELEEQRWFHRRIEVWRGERRIGGSAASAQLQTWKDLHSCYFATVGATSSRVCSIAVTPFLQIVAASPLAPLLMTQLPIFAAIALSACLAMIGFFVVARRVVRRGLNPLRAFEDILSKLVALDRRRVPDSWGASEIDQLASAFNSLLERIDAAVTREQQFVANAAHELRTPVTRLRGQIELVLQDGSLGEEPTRRLTLAARSCADLVRSLEAILALARDETATMEAVDLSDVASSIQDALDSEHRTRVRSAIASAIVRGEPTLLSLAVRNLVDNALKYSAGTVVVEVSETNGCCRLIVYDEGPGIADVDLQIVREPFVRGRGASAQARGAGLGLALVDHVVKQHAGTLTLEKRAGGQGLRAIMVFPVWRS